MGKLDLTVSQLRAYDQNVRCFAAVPCTWIRDHLDLAAALVNAL